MRSLFPFAACWAAHRRFSKVIIRLKRFFAVFIKWSGLLFQSFLLEQPACLSVWAFSPMRSHRRRRSRMSCSKSSGYPWISRHRTWTFWAWLGADDTKTDVVVIVIGIIVVASGAAQILIIVDPRAAAKRAVRYRLLSFMICRPVFLTTRPAFSPARLSSDFQTRMISN